MAKRKVAKAVRETAEKVVGKKAMKRLEVDHIKPLAEGGADALGNLQIVEKAAHRVKTQAEAVARARRRRK